MRRPAPTSIALACVAGTFVLAAAAGAPRDTETPPVLQRFNPSVTFYASFDRLPADAELSAGNGKAIPAAVPHELRDGLSGKALLCGGTLVAYDAADGNVDLARPGALAVWLSPRDWMRQGETPYLFLVRLHGSGRSMMIGRMGGADNQEALYAHAQVGDRMTSVLSGHTRDWHSGGWHLLVLNWRAEAIEFSVDGGELQRAAAPWLAGAKGDGGGLVVGNEGTSGQQYLVDDLSVFDRPLSHEEIQWLFEQGAARK